MTMYTEKTSYMLYVIRKVRDNYNIFDEALYLRPIRNGARKKLQRMIPYGLSQPENISVI